MQNKIINSIRQELVRAAGINSNIDRPRLEDYLLEGSTTAPCIIICPGGGYSFTSPRESEPVARAYNAQGFHAFVLHYRVSKDHHPTPLTDISNTTALIRKHAEDLNIHPNKIALCGFSAGGHLAASLGVHWNKPYLENYINNKRGLNRPDALVLCYPVISSGKHSHPESFRNLLGENPPMDLYNHLSLERHVGNHTPPVFIWHTVEDELVPMENSLIFIQELKKADVLFEFHLYTHGVHGMSLATEETAEPVKNRLPDSHLASWHKLSADWLNNLLQE